MLKRLLSMILAFSMLLSACPFYAAAEETTENPEEAIVEASEASSTEEPETEPAPETEAPAPETEPAETTPATVPETEPAPETEPVTEPAPEEGSEVPDAAAQEDAQDAAANPEYIPITLGKTITGELGAGESLYLTVKIPQDGTYLLASSDYLDLFATWEVSGAVYSAWLYGEYDVLRVSCKAGAVCKIRIQHEYTFPIDYNLTLSRTLDPDSISFSTYSVQNFVGLTTQVNYSYTPSDAIRDNIEWSIEDDIAELNVYDGYFTLKMITPGTTTLWAYLPTGVYVKCTVTSVAPEILECDVPKASVLGYGRTTAYHFTAPKDGTYFFRNTQDSYVQLKLQDPSGKVCGSGDSFMSELTAGTRYLLLVTAYNTNGQEILVSKCSNAESIAIEKDAYSGYAGTHLDILAHFLPENASEEKLVWTISDPEIAAQNYVYGNRLTLQLLNPGTVTVTVSTVSGELSDSCTVTVLETDALTPGYRDEVTIPEDSSHFYLFTAEETATYVIWEESGCEMNYAISLVNTAAESRTPTAQKRHLIHAQAGKTYLVEVYPPYEHTGSFDFTLCFEKAAPLESIALSKTSYTGQVDDYLTLEITDFSPVNALVDEITWTSEKEDVVAINWTYDQECALTLLKAGTSKITAACGDVTAVCTITVLNPETIEPGYQQSVTIARDETRRYTFTAAETREYICWTADWYSRSISVYDENGDHLDNGDPVSFQAEAGKTYTFEVRNYSDNDTFVLCFDKVVPLSGLKLNHSSYTSANIGDTLFLCVDAYLPSNTIPGDVTWSVEDPTVAVIEEIYGDCCYVKFLAPGTTRVKATCNGITASCTINIPKPIVITSGYAGDVAVPANESVIFTFTPTKSEPYVFWKEQDDYANFFLQDANGNYLSSSRDRLQFQAEAGTTYRIVVGSNPNYRSFRFHLDPVAPLESMTLNFSSYKGWVGEYLYLSVADYFPGTADLSGLTWRSGNEAVVLIEDTDNTGAGCDVKFVGTGSTKITATCGDVSVSCEVTVQEAAVITTPFSQTLPMAAGEQAGFRFTAAETANYVIWDASGYHGHIKVSEDGEYLAGENERMQFTAEAGKTYTILVQNVYDTPRTLSLNMTEAVPLEGLYMEQDSYAGWVGQALYMKVLPQPVNAWIETIRWSVSDSSILLLDTAYEDWCNMALVGEGTGTVTASCGSISTECTVAAITADPIEAPCTQTITIPSRGTAGYLFTPSESGNYVIWNTDGNSSDFTVLQDMDEHVANGYGRVQFYASAGMTYLIEAQNHMSTTLETTLHLSKAVALTGLTLTPSTYSGWVGQDRGLSVTPVPINGWLENLNWSISDATVLQKSSAYGDWCNVRLIGAGSATVTVSSGSISRKATFTVQTPIVMEAPFSKTITIASGQQKGFLFTPKETATYVFWESTPGSDSFPSGFTIYPENAPGFDSIGRIQFQGTAGVRYLILVSNTNNTTLETQLKLDKVAPLKGLSFEHETRRVYPDRGYAIFLTCEPGNADLSGMTVTSSDTGIVQIEYAADTCVGIVTKNCGAAVLTAACGDLTATCTITVTEEEHTHTYTSSVVKPTCTEKGYTLYTCSCGDSYTKKEVKALGHSFGAWAETLAPTELTEGSESRECSVCGHTETREIPRLKPQAPVVTISGDPATGQNILRWAEVAAAEEYRIYRATSKSGSYKLVSTTDALTYQDKSTSVGRTYYYKVKAATADDSTSVYSSIVYRTRSLPQPEIQLSSISSSGKIQVTWEDVSSASKYTLYRSSNCEDWDLLKTTTGTSYTDTSAESGKTYSYRLIAIASKSAANSVPSAVKSGICKLARPSVTADGVDSTGMTLLTWKAVEGASEYRITRCADGADTYEPLATVTETSYVDVTGIVGTKYSYRVQAVSENPEASSARSAAKARVTALPSPEVELTNVESSGKIQISWNAIEGAVRYKVYKATSKSGTYKYLTSTTKLSVQDTAVSVGKTYYYKVMAVSSLEDADSAYSAIQSRVCTLSQPAITLRKSGGNIKISWSKVKSAAKYRLYRSTDKESWTLLKTTSSTSYTDTATEAGITYFYRLRAVAKVSAASSAYSTAKSILCTLAAPEVTADTVSASGKIELSWEAVDGAVGYTLWRSESEDGQYLQIGQTDGTEYVDTSAEAGSAYFYKVIALAGSEAGNSDASGIVSETCDLPRPTVTLSADPVSGKPTVSWGKIEGASKYRIYRASSKSGSYKLVKTVTSDSYADTTASAGKTYYYKVRAIHENTDAYSAYSSIKSCTCILAQPQVTLAETSSGKVKLSWGKVSGVSKYRVYRSSNGTDWNLLKTTTSTSYTTSPKTGTTYYYRVMAIAKKSSANSVFSDVLSFPSE